MSDKKPGLLIRFVRGLWRALDWSRRLVLNFLFLLLLVFIASLFFAQRPVLQPRTALVIAPEGRIVEQYSADPVQRATARALGDGAPETRLRDILRAIEAAAGDARIERLVIRPDRVTDAGMAVAREIGAALRQFKKSGKQVIAYGDVFTQNQYYLAAFADEIHLHPDGALLLEGLSRYRNYYRTALQDKLGVNVHLFRVGEYKSAAEPFILDAPSEQAQTADLFWMNDLWQRYLSDIAAARHVKATDLQADIDAYDQRVEAAQGDLAQLAHEQGLVDVLSTQDELRALLIKRGVEDVKEHTFRQVALQDYLHFVDSLELPFEARPRIAVVVAEGEIVNGEPPPGMVGGVSTASLIREAREDNRVKALVLRVDSPGGEVFPSEQIRREVELTRVAGKPVVVSMGNVAASGGYWISMNADEIWADESTITGSIGIFGLFFTLPDTLDRIGIHTGGVGTTRLAGALDPRRPLQPMVGDIIQTVINKGYREFIGKVAAARGSSPEAIDQVARGRVWSGAQAKERGLVDKLGGLTDAVVAAAGRAGLKNGDYETHYIEKSLSPFEQFLTSTLQDARVAAWTARLGIPAALFGEKNTQQFARDLALLTPPAAQPFRVAAHCFCDL